MINLCLKYNRNLYYPFGLKHNYNNTISKYQKAQTNDRRRPKQIVEAELDYKYKYQGQERQDELGLNWDSFKWRNYDYALGRFMSVDPLAEDYEWQSVYSFSSNQPIHAPELEGKESLDDLNKALSNAIGYASDVGSGIVEQINSDLAQIESEINTFENNIVEGDFGAALDQVARVNSAAFGMQKVSSGDTTDLSDGKTIGKVIGSILPIVVVKKNKMTAVKSANIQKAAQQGIPKSQLGPSGKPKIHTVSKANNKRARDAARNNRRSNTKPVKHSSDKNQKTHYHPTRDGKKLKGKDNTHYEDRSTKKNL